MRAKFLTFATAITLVALHNLSAFCSVASAAPSATGKYGGFTADNATAVSFESTAQGRIRNFVVVGLTSFCATTIPGQEQLPGQSRTTNIVRRETPVMQLRSNGRFSATFELPSRNRVDFRGASIQVSGRLRGKKGTVSILLEMTNRYEDGSVESCGGSVTVPVERSRR